MIVNTIVDVLKNSIAEELEIGPGDELVSINGEKIVDYIDYKYQISDDEVLLEIKKPNGEIWDLEIEKEYDEDLGIIFKNPLMDNIKVCSNNCIFCFVDQMPKGMRKTLYIKDDDSRLSFLYGNFITLTNLSDEEINRMIKYRISPIKVSVHVTDTILRNKMIRNKKSKDIMECLKKLADGGLTVDCQIVLCKDINDGEVLNNTINDLVTLYPNIRSVAVVPVGLTNYRNKLYELQRFDKQSSTNLINQIEVLQKDLYNKLGTRFVFISDEFYVMAGKEFPPYQNYEEFNQIENGIGIFRLFEKEIDIALKKVIYKSSGIKEITVVTGAGAYELICKLTRKISSKTNIRINVEKIVNNCFGNFITVAGLVTGNDIISQLKGKDIDRLIIPKVMVEHEDEIFLDDVRIKDLEEELNTKVSISEVEGDKFVELLIEIDKEDI